eukprot:10091693-Ditylum_brightwellii.AAC.2
MEYCTELIKACKATRALEKGLLHHHSKCRMVQMQKSDGTKATTDEENAEVFVSISVTSLTIKTHCLVTSLHLT